MNIYKNKKVVVTGGSGFIGTHFIQELLERGANIRTSIHKTPLKIQDDRIEVLENIDLTKFDDVMKLVEGVDIVIHCAGNILHPSTVAADYQVGLSHIVIMTNVLEACYKSNVKKFLDLNSSTGYPDKEHPITEYEYFEGEPYISYYNYGWMRRYREKLMEHTSHLCDMHIGIARGTAIFGPHDNFDLESCHVVPALIKRHLSGEDPFVVWGSPDVVRDFLYVKDVVDGALLILQEGVSMRPYNLGYGSTITIGDIVNTILKITGKAPEVRWNKSKPTTIPFRACSTERIETELGFKPKYTFEKGMKETIDWYENNL